MSGASIGPRVAPACDYVYSRRHRYVAGRGCDRPPLWRQLWRPPGPSWLNPLAPVRLPGRLGSRCSILGRDGCIGAIQNCIVHRDRNSVAWHPGRFYQWRTRRSLLRALRHDPLLFPRNADRSCAAERAGFLFAAGTLCALKRVDMGLVPRTTGRRNRDHNTVETRPRRDAVTLHLPSV